jgi:hypothetical protein
VVAAAAAAAAARPGGRPWLQPRLARNEKLVPALVATAAARPGGRPWLQAKLARNETLVRALPLLPLAAAVLTGAGEVVRDGTLSTSRVMESGTETAAGQRPWPHVRAGTLTRALPLGGHSWWVGALRLRLVGQHPRWPTERKAGGATLSC